MTDLDPIAFLLVDSVLEGREGAAARAAAIAYARHAEPVVARRLLNAVCEYEEWPFEPGRIVREYRFGVSTLGYVVHCRQDGDIWKVEVRSRKVTWKGDADSWEPTEVRLEVSTLEALEALNLPLWDSEPARPYMHYIPGSF